jgi:hypothetical protein
MLSSLKHGYQHLEDIYCLHLHGTEDKTNIFLWNIGGSVVDTIWHYNSEDYQQGSENGDSKFHWNGIINYKSTTDEVMTMEAVF